MRCKEGDLAIVIKAENPQDIGMMVTCLKFVGVALVTHPNGEKYLSQDRDIWEIDRQVTWVYRDDTPDMRIQVNLAPDSYLLPIRPDEHKDEEDQCNAPVEEALVQKCPSERKDFKIPEQVS